MEKSIQRTILLYAVIQLFCISVFVTRAVSLQSVLIYDGICVIFHVILYIFLMHFKADFYNQSTNQPLSKINTANRITLLRISSLPFIAFLLGHNEIAGMKTILPILLALIFLTDSFDGQIARRRKQITKMGAMLDSISDYSLITLISIVYFMNDVVPRWFFFLIVIRLFLQAFGMFVFILLKKPVPMKSTWGGKITIATTMTLYIIELVRMYLSPDFAPVFRAIEYVSGAIIFALCFEKASIFFRQGKEVRLDREKDPNSIDQE
jgi:CDP-diacylglycerol--glycerol-3-phosphate 3-phosphatidyltransferase